MTSMSMKSAMKAALLTALAACSIASHAGACPSDTSWRERLVAQINALRAAGGACASEGQFAPGGQPVSWNPQLENVAAAQTEWMAESGRLSHSGRSGEGLVERVQRVAYVYQRIAENVAWGQMSLEQVVQAWRESPKHCRNLLDPRLTEVALSCTLAPSGPWWSISLGTPLRARAVVTASTQ